MKDFRHFCFEALVICALFCMLDLSTGVIFPRVNSYFIKKYPNVHTSRMGFATELTNADILIIGASTASHNYIPYLITDSLNLTCYNAGIDGANLYFQSAFIHLILDRYKPKCIIWEFDEDMLSYNSTNNNLDYQNVYRLRPYIYNSECMRICESESPFECIKLLSSFYRYNNTLPAYIYSTISRRTFKDGYVPLDDPQDEFPTFLMEIVDESINEDKVDLFDNTLKFCKDKHIEIIFTSSPRYQKDDIKNTMQYKQYRSMISKYGFHFIDSYNCAPFNSDSTLFRDNQHMNTKGTELYMQQFIPKLKKIINGY